MDLPDEDNVMRYIKKRLLQRDESGEVIGVLPQAFELRENESKLSVNWLEFYKNDSFSENINDTVNGFRKTLSVSKNDGFAYGECKNIIETCHNNNSIKAKIVHSPSKNNKSHSSIIRIKKDDSLLMEALASDAFDNLILNKDIP